MRRIYLVLSLILLVAIVTGCLMPATPVSSLFQVVTTTPPPTRTSLAGEPVPSLEGTSHGPPTASATPSVAAEPTATQNSSTARIESPSATALAFNPSATASPTPSATSTIGPTNTPSRRATRTPTITATPPIPAAGVQFAEPGPMSKVVSPLHMVATLRSVPSGNYRVELWAEPLEPGGEPRLLYRDVQRIISNPVEWLFLDQDIQFELTRVSEFGQLRVSVYDPNDRPVSINSVDLLLLSMGPSGITPSTVRSEPIVIRQPLKNKLIQGGKVIVSGLVRPSNGYLLAELEAVDGTVVGYRQAFVDPAADGSYVPFSVEVPYTVTAGTWVLLEVSESGTRITGMERLSSVVIYLSP